MLLFSFISLPVEPPGTGGIKFNLPKRPGIQSGKSGLNDDTDGSNRTHEAESQPSAQPASNNNNKSSPVSGNTGPIASAPVANAQQQSNSKPPQHAA